MHRESRSLRASRFAVALSSPRALRVVIPLIVALCTLVVSVIGERALTKSTQELTRARFQEETRVVADGVGGVLASADPLLGTMREAVLAAAPQLDLRRDPAKDPVLGNLARALAAAVRVHEGVVYASVSFPNGHYLDAHVDKDAGLRFDVIRDALDGADADALGGALKQRTRYTFTGFDGLVLEGEQLSRYDPRQRPFYELALRTRGAAWTSPYLFFDDRATGITRTLPVYQAEVLIAVLTIDFNLTALSDFVGRLQRESSALSLLHTDDGSLLALPDSLRPKVPPSGERPMRYTDIPSPTVRAFFVAPPGDREVLTVTTGTGVEQVMALTAQVPGAGDLRWYVTALVPESVHAGILREHRKRSVLAMSVAVVASVLLGLLVGGYMQRAQRLVVQAQLAARDAASRAERAEGVAKKLGSYELVHRIGVGGMGEVWRATHRLLPRDAAVKLIRPEFLQGHDAEQVQQRFRREARSLAELRSRNTVNILDYGVARDGSLFLVMDLLEGLDARQMIELGGPMPPSRVVFLMIQVCRSLAEAHGLGLVHRDLKPGNIFISKAADEVDIVKVLDFGLVHDARTTGTANDAPAAARDRAVGTPGYMAPEQLLGGDLTPATDVYALGCVMVFLLTGKRLHEGSDTASVLAAHILEPIPAFETGLALPAPLVALVRRCLDTEPEKRPRDGQALLQALEALEATQGLYWTREQARSAWESITAYLERQSVARQSTPPRLLSVVDQITQTGEPTDQG